MVVTQLQYQEQEVAALVSLKQQGSGDSVIEDDPRRESASVIGEVHHYYITANDIDSRTVLSRGVSRPDHDDFLVIVTYGLWDGVSSIDIRAYVHTLLEPERDGKDIERDDVAPLLVEEVLRGGIDNNITIVVFWVDGNRSNDDAREGEEDTEDAKDCGDDDATDDDASSTYDRQ